MVSADDFVAERRAAKRVEGVQAVKRTPAYIVTKTRHGEERPLTPDPFAALSKRGWEKGRGFCFSLFLSLACVMQCSRYA